MYLFIVQTFVGLLHYNVGKFIFSIGFLNSKEGNNNLIVNHEQCIEHPKIILMKEMNNEVREAFRDVINHLELKTKSPLSVLA